MSVTLLVSHCSLTVTRYTPRYTHSQSTEFMSSYHVDRLAICISEEGIFEKYSGKHLAYETSSFLPFFFRPIRFR